MPAKGCTVERELSVIGGGVIGLSCALAAADAGWAVSVFDAGASRRAAQVAGGMLGCFGEGHPGEAGLLDIAAASVARWPAFVDRLADPGIMTARDSLLIAASAADLAQLDEQVRFVRARIPDAAPRLVRSTAAELRASEPGLARGIAGGYFAVGEGAVDNRRLLDALGSTLRAAGVRFVDACVADPAQASGDQVLITAGLDSPAVAAAAGAEVAVRGEKGEILRLRRTRWSVPPPGHVVRGRWHGRTVYLVPRADGLVLGATQYESVDHADRAPIAGGVSDLLADGGELMPGLRTYELAEVSAGIRPSSVDGLPIVRRLDDRVLVATGHGRNGIALSPWTADRVLELLA
ncbi:FAD-dependent oxidoreductase [Gordonia zhaorongruii]|uniref:FAD-dependent oxidoreductase n=1 Tax=Gordonia zhaorongruii TaxID=2597659 RepID=UPI00140470F9|nr:FAD-dependent oxidoreductase [Gordonia zhaorongruii]